ncbi:BatA domain-containing protein [Algoriphagus halophilus]|uniref:N-terminal double-transmembrane domain-containing protein n=1 Tax=Algoriphagus halophilus TaxID=226505 RepID=A0A1N6EGD0_9BACT|nr:BatA domain-containing protein [Algoriphagus halophilus]SIN82088.1 N-terminal double-transmembrane domain-containing protein [Algoriphagus halophilus]
MEFLQPILLWGLLGLSIPIAIHLWNGKKGKTISWAAMAWLSEQENQSSKSIRLDQILVLLLRLILLTLLVLLLSKLILKFWLLPDETKTVHLVTPDQQVFEEYRFEIDRAMDAGEEVFWLEPELSEVTTEINPNWLVEKGVQETLNNLEGPISELHIYLPNSQSYLPEIPIISPVKPIVHIAKSAKMKPAFTSIKADSSYVLEQNELGVLEVSSTSSLNPSKKELLELSYFLGNLGEGEKSTIRAAMNSISEVMKIKCVETDQQDQGNLVFDSQKPDHLDPSTFYFLVSHQGYSMDQNVVLIQEQLNFDQSEMVRNGQLPEFILVNFLEFLGIQPLSAEVTQHQIESRFIAKETPKEDKKSGFEIVLVALFVLTYGAERYYSNQRGI